MSAELIDDVLMSAVTLLCLAAAVLTAACFGPQLYRALIVKTGVSVSAWLQSSGLGSPGPPTAWSRGSGSCWPARGCFRARQFGNRLPTVGVPAGGDLDSLLRLGGVRRLCRGWPWPMPLGRVTGFDHGAARANPRRHSRSYRRRSLGSNLVEMDCLQRCVVGGGRVPLRCVLCLVRRRGSASAATADGTLATIGDDQLIRIFPTSDGAQQREINCIAETKSVALRPDGQVVAVGTSRKSIELISTI